MKRDGIPPVTLEPIPEIQWLDAQVVDAEVAAPAGKPCEACGTPVEPLDKFCPACRLPNPEYRPATAAHGDDRSEVPSPGSSPRGRGSEEESPRAKHFQCQTCGAEAVSYTHLTLPTILRV